MTCRKVLAIGGPFDQDFTNSGFDGLSEDLCVIPSHGATLPGCNHGEEHVLAVRQHVRSVNDLITLGRSCGFRRAAVGRKTRDTCTLPPEQNGIALPAQTERYWPLIERHRRAAADIDFSDGYVRQRRP